MSGLASKMKHHWERTKSRNAHLGVSGEEAWLFARYRTLVTDEIDVCDKTVVDFGMGGGLFGKYLLTNFKIKRYVGYDIAERSMKKAEENLYEFKNKELILLLEHRWSFAEKCPDVIVCLACIIHFPTRTYLDNVLLNMDASNAEWLVLEIRDTGVGTQFQNEPYASNRAVRYACVTTPEYVSERLINYAPWGKTRNDLESELGLNTQCQVLWYRRRA